MFKKMERSGYKLQLTLVGITKIKYNKKIQKIKQNDIIQ
jgi:hypothetical protein